MTKWTVSLAVKEMQALGMPELDKVTEGTLMKYAKKIRFERRKRGLSGRVVVEKKKPKEKKRQDEVHHLPPEKKTAKLWRKFTRRISEEEKVEIKDVREHLPFKAFKLVPDDKMNIEVLNAWNDWKAMSEN